MLPRELIRKLRKLEIVTRKLVNQQLAGQYHSVFKGRGMDFDGLREYGVEDDALRIDWNASSRLGRPYMKTYRDDRSDSAACSGPILMVAHGSAGSRLSPA